MPRVDWIFFSPLGSIGYFPNQPVYSFPFFAPGSIRPGSYDSADDQYVETPGDDIWLDLKFEYVLPQGNARLSGMADYRLKKNFLQSGASGESLSRQCVSRWSSFLRQHQAISRSVFSQLHWPNPLSLRSYHE